MQGKVPKYCLKSDIGFVDHEEYSENRSDSEICEESYDFKKIQRAFAPNRLDKIKQSVKIAIENQNLKERGKQAAEKIKNKFSKNELEFRTDTTKALVISQPSRLSRIFNAIVNKMRSFFNRFSNKKEKNPEIEEVVESNSEKMPSWDLRNWSPEELQTFTATRPYAR